MAENSMSTDISNEWLLRIGELILRGETAQARLNAEQYAVWRDGHLTDAETISCARASIQ